MTKENLEIVQNSLNRYGLRGMGFSTRVPEKSEQFNKREGRIYRIGCDYPESVDDPLLALEVQEFFGPERIHGMTILDAMCGPGQLGREFLELGAQHVIFHDGDNTMITHAKNKAFKILKSGQSLGFVRSDVRNIPLPDDMIDLIVCHNSTHQLSSNDSLPEVMKELLRITRPGGYVFIADYQRATTEEYFTKLDARLDCTKEKIVPLLIPSFRAAFSKEEFSSVLLSIPGIKSWSVTDAQPPVLNREWQERVNKDWVLGHLMDYSLISLRVIVQKEQA